MTKPIVSDFSRHGVIYAFKFWKNAGKCLKNLDHELLNDSRWPRVNVLDPYDYLWNGSISFKHIGNLDKSNGYLPNGGKCVFW